MRAVLAMLSLVFFIPTASAIDIHDQRGWTQSAPSQETLGTYRKAPKSRKAARAAPVSHGGGSLVTEARRYLGGNPTGRASLWCADFMNLVLERTGHSGTGTRMARDFASYGTRIGGPQVGAIAVMTRGKRGGHVGIVSGIDERGNPIVISGNHNRRVAESVYPARRVYAYVMPR